MKKLFLTTVIVGVAAVIMSGCGGGSKKSGLKKNEYLGALPAIQADFKLEEKADAENLKMLRTKGPAEKWAKENEKVKEKRRKNEADLKAEWEKIAGKEVPFSYSKAFAESVYEVASAKLASESKLCIEFTFKVKQDFEVNNKNGDAYRLAYFRAITKDGSTITKGMYNLVHFSWGHPQSFSKGQTIGNPYALYLFQPKYAEKWADFAGIEFVTEDEYNKISE